MDRWVIYSGGSLLYNSVTVTYELGNKVIRLVGQSVIIDFLG